MTQVDRAPSLEELRACREEILRISAFRGAGKVRIFGSVARGESGTDSDVDLIVEMEPGRTVLDLSELILDLEAVLDRRVDVVEARQGTPNGERILRQSVPL